MIDMRNSDFSKATLETYQCVPNTYMYRDYIDHCITERAKYPKGSLMNKYWKLKRNSLYGSIAQSGGKKSSKNYMLGKHGSDNIVLKPGKLFQPFYASYITTTTQILAQEGQGYVCDKTGGTCLDIVTDGFSYVQPAGTPEFDLSTIRGHLTDCYKHEGSI